MTGLGSDNPAYVLLRNPFRSDMFCWTPCDWDHLDDEQHANRKQTQKLRFLFVRSTGSHRGQTHTSFFRKNSQSISVQFVLIVKKIKKSLFEIL